MFLRYYVVSKEAKVSEYQQARKYTDETPRRCFVSRGTFEQERDGSAMKVKGFN